MSGIGRRSSRTPAPSRYATGSCLPWPTTVRCAVRNSSSWRFGDFGPAYCLIHLQAETTKSKRAREVSFGTATSRLYMAYLAERRRFVGRAAVRLLISVSRRNRGAPLGQRAGRRS